MPGLRTWSSIGNSAFPYLSLTFFALTSFSCKNLSWYIWPLISPRFMKQALWKLFGFLQNMVMQLHAFMLMELCHCGRRLLKVSTASSMLELGSVVHGSFVFYACLPHILWMNTFAGYTNFMQQVIYFDFRPWPFWHIVPCSTTISSAFHLICLFLPCSLFCFINTAFDVDMVICFHFVIYEPIDAVVLNFFLFECYRFKTPSMEALQRLR